MTHSLPMQVLGWCKSSSLRYSGLQVIKNALQFIQNIPTYFRMSHQKHILGLLWNLIHNMEDRRFSSFTQIMPKNCKCCFWEWQWETTWMGLDNYHAPIGKNIIRLVFELRKRKGKKLPFELGRPVIFQSKASRIWNTPVCLNCRRHKWKDKKKKSLFLLSIVNKCREDKIRVFKATR